MLDNTRLTDTVKQPAQQISLYPQQISDLWMFMTTEPPTRASYSQQIAQEAS